VARGVSDTTVDRARDGLVRVDDGIEIGEGGGALDATSSRWRGPRNRGGSSRRRSLTARIATVRNDAPRVPRLDFSGSLEERPEIRFSATYSTESVHGRTRLRVAPIGFSGLTPSGLYGALSSAKAIVAQQLMQ
jgi:hypothetical protein